MFENIINFFKKFNKTEDKTMTNSKEAAKERLHLVLMQDRANVSADFLELMKQEIIEVIKKYIDVDERAIDVRLTNKENDNGTNGAPALYANIPILNIKNEARKVDIKEETNKEHKKEEENNKEENNKEENNKEDKKQEIEKTVDKEDIEEAKNERISHAIIDGEFYNINKKDKKQEQKKSKEEQKNEDNKKQEEEQEQNKVSKKQEKKENTKEEFKSEN